MPPRVRVTKEQILEAAMRLVRRSGIDALNARAVAAEAGCSTQPVFSNFETLEQLKEAVIRETETVYRGYLNRALESSRWPLYKASGMGYIQFAKDEPQLFRLLFTTPITALSFDRGWSFGVDALVLQTGLTREKAERFHLEMWLFVHGIAAVMMKGFIQFEEEQICSMLTDMYTGLCHRHLSDKEGDV